MLRTTPRNQQAIEKIHAAIESAWRNIDAPEPVPTVAMVKAAVEEANADQQDDSGERSVTWKIGPFEHTITWILKQGSVLEIGAQTVKAGAVRILRKQKILLAS